MSLDHDDDLTPELRAGLAGLRRELPPSDLLEERVVRALRQRRLLRSRNPLARPARWASGLAAALLLFLIGWTAGQWQVPEPPVAQSETANVTSRVEEAGTAYVQAVAALAEQGSKAADSKAQEAALSSLRAAASELSLVREDDPTLGQVVTLLDQASGEAPPEPSTPNQVFWF